MKRTVRLLALATAPVLLLAACGSSGADEVSPSTEAPAAEAATTDESDSWPIVEDENGNVEENPTGASDGGEDLGEDDGSVVMPGEAGVFSTIGMDLPKGEGEISVKVADYECGLTSIPEGADNPVYMESGGEEGEEYIDAEAPDGKEFCVFDMEYENVGKTPYQVDDPGAVSLDNGEFHEQSAEDHDISWKIQDYVIDLNPGDKGEYKHVVSVPAGSKPVALFYPGETMVLDSTMVLILQ
ncbi:DUF4352 domain-containing protein [Brachybacterium squillarum]|uniref:DUF4352 domain-containing protein n=1 Tax=Brachybacterium squillarum TaxID=661979 RepID=UPI002221E396|nr:DUF4352 domain-containing protein [Brachybacterium squillarum]MCW1805269.1 DUF4352 domain-containing protein [Brachybacterium squillarum]